MNCLGCGKVMTVKSDMSLGKCNIIIFNIYTQYISLETETKDGTQATCYSTVHLILCDLIILT